MRDSVQPSAIPRGTPIVAGYVDGAISKWPDSAWAMFPYSKFVKIATSAATDDGNCLDVEQFDATPDQAPQWVAKRRLKGVDPTVYVNRANYTAVRGQFIAQHVAQPWYWLSTLDGTLQWLDRVVAVQYMGSKMTGHNYDESLVIDHWPTIDGADNQPGGNAMQWHNETIPTPDTFKATAGLSCAWGPDGSFHVVGTGEDGKLWHVWYGK